VSGLLHYDVSAIRGAVDITEVVAKHVKLRRRGHDRYVGLCPFHQEKTASFHVIGDKQFSKCFGCGASGDVITFVDFTDSAFRARCSFWPRCTIFHPLANGHERKGGDTPTHLNQPMNSGSDSLILREVFTLCSNLNSLSLVSCLSVAQTSRRACSRSANMRIFFVPLSREISPKYGTGCASRILRQSRRSRPKAEEIESTRKRSLAR
jgi:hypothetical protein